MRLCSLANSYKQESIAHTTAFYYKCVTILCESSKACRHTVLHA